MFSRKKDKQGSNKPQNRIDTLIGATTCIEGHVSFSGGLRVDGVIRGNIRSAESAPEGAQDTLVVSAQASVEGEISVGHVVINGTVTGPIFASQSLELMSNAKVTGDIEYQQLEIHQGAIIQGRLLHKPAQHSSAKAVELKLASSS
ncbi:MAG: polymer-forming cytoskeletal protein [Pseudomonadota bacterium]